MIDTRLIETTVHGRYLVRLGDPARVIVGFHGYAETADTHLAELERIPGAGAWTLVAVQALHPFYVRGGSEVVASWMTRIDREEAIGDNVAYVRRVVGTLGEVGTLVFAGFSQGAEMAYRAAAAIPSSGLIILGGHVPPDVESAVELPPVLIGRGRSEEWFTAEKLKNNLSFLEAITSVRVCEFDGGHEWTDGFRNAAGEFLAAL